jgi:acetylornithine deacetylase/succinyl-diaminopimelate desuccinylase-like protein
MKKATLFILTVLLVTSSNIAISQVSGTGKFDVRTSIEKWVYFLASDEMRGRANGSPEMKVAAEYLADIYRNAGLKPGFGADYIRPYTLTSRNRTLEERNVAAVIPGTNPALKDEYIVITAHFDHVGIGRPVNGDSIYNGADDNAAGTASILAVASSIMARGLRPGRTLVFISVSGEEMGMRGARNYVAEPAIDLDKVYVNLNIEMPGYNKILGKNQFYMTGESMTNIDDLIRNFNHPSGLEA